MLDKSQIALANATLNLLESRAIDHKIDAYVYMYANCREQGYHVVTNWNGPAVSFAVHRYGLGLIVYWGKASDFDEHGIINDKECKTNNRYFERVELDKAVEFIASKLESDLICVDCGESFSDDDLYDYDGHNVCEECARASGRSDNE